MLLEQYTHGGLVLAYLRGLVNDQFAGALAGKVIVDHLINTKRINNYTQAESYVHGMSELDAEQIFTEIVSANWQ